MSIDDLDAGWRGVRWARGFAAAMLLFGVLSAVAIPTLGRDAIGIIGIGCLVLVIVAIPAVCIFVVMRRRRPPDDDQ